jgi:2-isopropylmalate synthase
MPREEIMNKIQFKNSGSCMQSSDLIYDWNIDPTYKTVKPIQLCDETLRDGLQGNLPRLPSVDEKLNLLARADRLGLSEACVGFPAQTVAYQDALALFKGAKERRLRLPLGLVGRMVKSDIEAIASIQQASGHPAIAKLAMMGSSPMRRYVESRNLDELERLMREGVGYATQLDLPTHVSIEDVSRSEPKVIERLFSAAVESGATLVSICDTVGHITPFGTKRVVRHFRKFLNEQGYQVRLGFHGHNDRGLGVANALAAIEAGIDLIDCTVLGIGERTGNIPLDLTLVNLKIQGLWSGDISSLKDYCQEVARVCQLIIPPNYPIFGSNAFVTQAGVHASAILKAEIRGEPHIAALVYSPIDPHWVGLDYEIYVGPSSGRSNVQLLLHRKGLNVEERAIELILHKARRENRILSEEEVYELATNSK